MLRPTLDERRNFIAEIAAKVFSEKGYGSASLQEICEEAGISKGGIYHYFEAKEDILFYIIKFKHQQFVELLKDCAKKCQAQSLSPENTFKKLMYTYADFLNSERDVSLIVLHDRHQLSGENKQELRRIEQEIFQTVKSQLNKIPNINSEYNTGLVSFMIISISHWMGSWLREDGKMSQHDAIEQSIEIILHGVLETKKASSRLNEDAAAPRIPGNAFSEGSM